MKLSIKHSQGAASADDLQRLSDFINLIIGEMGLPPDHITDIVVADEDHFGAAVEELCPGAGFTDDGVYLAIGKTFHRREATGRVRSSMVLLDRSVGVAYMQRCNPESVQKMDPINDVGIYAVYHEFGHCLDAERRSSEPVGDGERSLGAIVLEEYAASRHSARHLSRRGFDEQQGLTCGNLRNYLEQLLAARRAYRGREDLAKLTQLAGQTFQRILVEHAKEFAFRHGNHGIEDAKLTLWAADSLLEQLLREWGAELQNAWAAYPNCAAQFRSLSNEYFNALTELHGYRFETRADGLYLWFN